MNTPHINAEGKEIAKTVLMPGDPLRSKFIAETFLENPVLFNNVRGVQGYTGTYKGHKVSVMASGMGMPSIGIYSYELFNFFGVENIIRVGSAGGMSEKLKLRDIVFGLGANTNSSYAEQYGVKGTIAPVCSYELLTQAVRAAKELGVEPVIGNLYSSDNFYSADTGALKKWTEVGSLAVEMEAAALYLNAMMAKKNALAICTISDLPFTGEECSAKERQNTFTKMMEIALETAVKMDK